MVISLLHPSRGRPIKSLNTSEYWLNMSGLEDVELILSLDRSDDWRTYSNTYEPLSSLSRYPIVRMFLNDNTCVVDATNYAAKESKGDIIIYVSDDFKCPDNWGQLILKEFEGVTEPMLLKVDDCLQKFETPICTIPIMNRALYERLGYFWNPEYKSMFVDEDLYWTCKNNGWLKLAPHLKFPHEHYSNGKAEHDETYKKSEANWNQGKAVFQKRRALGFPV